MMLFVAGSTLIVGFAGAVCSPCEITPVSIVVVSVSAIGSPLSLTIT